VRHFAGVAADAAVAFVAAEVGCSENIGVEAAAACVAFVAVAADMEDAEEPYYLVGSSAAFVAAVEEIPVVRTEAVGCWAAVSSCYSEEVPHFAERGVDVVDRASVGAAAFASADWAAFQEDPVAYFASEDSYYVDGSFAYVAAGVARC